MNRYQRQLAIIGHDGQELLEGSTVLVIGAGGIGSPVLNYLAAAGVGQLIVVDHDTVELSNLHRQTLFNEADIGCHKAHRAAETLSERNSDVVIEAYPCEFTVELAQQLMPSVDLVIDSTDNYGSRYLINDSCVAFRKPLISCSVFKNIIQLALFDTRTICYRCVYPHAPPAGMIPNCAEAGVLGTVTGIAGTLTANLAIHYLVQIDDGTNPTLRIFDAGNFSLDSFPLQANKNCIACKQKEINAGHIEYGSDIPANKIEFGVYLEAINREDYLLVDVRTRQERELIKLDDDLFFPINEQSNYDFFLSYREKKILLYCAAAHRSQFVAAELRAKGVDAYYLKNPILPL
ncbi:MAG: thiamine biosynthesis protein ThiF [Legionellales bacterium RIFCSPHIGHO2_12_FULL_42_9]|nr:MAG: thiamine biosynthesis protein ThiF [Legionellales bacterium RIFCSPHIGHO2_12_FULL_42_9]